MTTEEQQLVERLREGTTIRLSETAATYTPPPKLQIEAADTITRLVEEAAAPPVGALKAIADIREVTGLGAKPMLTELGGGQDAAFEVRLRERREAPDVPLRGRKAFGMAGEMQGRRSPRRRL